MTDILIIGAGTAGLSAAIYGIRSGLSVLVIEQMIYGGQIANTPDVENYPGIASISGFEFAQNIYNQAVALGAEVVYETPVQVELNGDIKRVITDQNTYEGRCVIIANGVERRKLGCEGEERLSGRGVSYCATCDGAFYKGKDVCIVGGGNTALEDALYLSNNCKKVHLIHRRDAFRASKIIVDSVLSRDNIEIHYDSVVDKIEGKDVVESVVLSNKKTGERTEIPCQGVFIAVGLVAKNHLFAGVVETDEGGYIKAGEDCHTNLPGVFAAGDTRTKSVRQLVTAAADGAVAAMEAANYVGEVPALH
ncbi:thioredoxin-disulfide reductase [Zongyangia hominis]|uniref:Thioredoxin reductase n=1 Tax=Zongyangia hominis TaxID=2763677 RepID=A0A926E9I1_9FIRM|nr:thioredoxin-disulfide reductase [Zongyangia hominis]MBC8570395.1 thioredoxin-disulfide reductase [Zongyangia hominis]